MPPDSMIGQCTKLGKGLVKVDTATLTFVVHWCRFTVHAIRIRDCGTKNADGS